MEQCSIVLESQLYTAVISDGLDGMSYRDQVMRADLNPLVEGRLWLAGYARCQM